MRQKTKNYQNQGSIDKKFDFFPQSPTHIPRWVYLVQKTRAKNSHAWAPLKVPKHENFSIAFFALSEPIWGCDVGTAKKSNFFIDWPLILMVLGFLPHIECAVNKKKFEARPKLKVGGGCIWAHKHAYNVFFGKCWSFSSFMNVKKV